MAYDATPRDPMRNFKFQVLIIGSNIGADGLNMGFTNVAGINMTTEAIPYREGGWNTNYHKLPGTTDFGPLSLVQGIMYNRPGMWRLAQNLFAHQWGAGNLQSGSTFRFNMTVRVLDHPVTQGIESGSPAATQPGSGARLAFRFENCWVGSVAFNDLDSAGNAVLISQMTVHHEGFDVLYGQDAINA